MLLLTPQLPGSPGRSLAKTGARAGTRTRDCGLADRRVTLTPRTQISPCRLWLPASFSGNPMGQKRTPVSDQQPALPIGKWPPRRDSHPYHRLERPASSHLRRQGGKIENTRPASPFNTHQGAPRVLNRTTMLWSCVSQKRTHTVAPLVPTMSSRFGRPRDLMRTLAD